MASELLRAVQELWENAGILQAGLRSLLLGHDEMSLIVLLFTKRGTGMPGCLVGFPLSV